MVGGFCVRLHIFEEPVRTHIYIFIHIYFIYYMVVVVPTFNPIALASWRNPVAEADKIHRCCLAMPFRLRIVH